MESLPKLKKSAEESLEIENSRCVLMGFFKTAISDDEIEYKMQEFQSLARAALLDVVQLSIQRRDKIEAATYIGTGKVEELKEICADHDAAMLIFNVELSGAQIRNLSDLTGAKVIDRTALILDIFATRAKSSIAKLQVELAQYKYLLPRLKGYGSEMSDTGAGIGTRGPGEQKLELDKRKIHDKVHDCEERLKEAEKKRDITRRSRVKSGIKTVSLLGYTNAGKSSLMNLFVDRYPGEAEDQKVFVKDMLFATLETYHRRINFENKRSFVLSDTVGFVSDLPHSLVKAFASTLEEVTEVDLILHVVDLASEEFLKQMKISDDIMDELGASRDNRILVLNKIDLIVDRSAFEAELQEWFPGYERGLDLFYLSCETGEGFEALKAEIEKRLFGEIVNVSLLIPYSEGAILQELMDLSKILSTEYLEQGTLLEVEISVEKYKKFLKYDKNEK